MCAAFEAGYDINAWSDGPNSSWTLFSPRQTTSPPEGGRGTGQGGGSGNSQKQPPVRAVTPCCFHVLSAGSSWLKGGTAASAEQRTRVDGVFCHVFFVVRLAHVNCMRLSFCQHCSSHQPRLFALLQLMSHRFWLKSSAKKSSAVSNRNIHSTRLRSNCQR